MQFVKVPTQQIETLIREICALHEMFSRDFVAVNACINLKKQQVRNVVSKDSKIVDSAFLELLQNYHEFVSKLIISLEYEYEYQNLDFRMRVKQKDSIFNKLMHYSFGKDEAGMMALNKCLNDLLGFRIIIDSFDHVNNGLNILCQSIEYKISCIVSAKDGYIATHIYFQGENKYFPWELQIWHTNDAVQNERSHQEHKSKREYIKWPEMYRSSTTQEKKSGGEE